MKNGKFKKQAQYWKNPTVSYIPILSVGQTYSGDFAKICGLLRIYELYCQPEVLKFRLMNWVTYQLSTIICRIDENPECTETGISLKLEFPTQNQTDYVPRPEYQVKLRQDTFTAKWKPDPELTNIVPENSTKSR